MIVYGCLKKFSRTIHIPKRVVKPREVIILEAHTSNNLGEEEKMNGLVNSTRSILVWVDILSRLILRGQTPGT